MLEYGEVGVGATWYMRLEGGGTAGKDGNVGRGERRDGDGLAVV